jgi:hypothetical protein
MAASLAERIAKRIRKSRRLKHDAALNATTVACKNRNLGIRIPPFETNQKRSANQETAQFPCAAAPLRLESPITVTDARPFVDRKLRAGMHFVAILAAANPRFVGFVSPARGENPAF